MSEITLESIRGLLFERGYITDHSIEMALFLSLKLQNHYSLKIQLGLEKQRLQKS
jgi:hypothetical protein